MFLVLDPFIKRVIVIIVSVSGVLKSIIKSIGNLIQNKLRNLRENITRKIEKRYLKTYAYGERNTPIIVNGTTNG